jgi:hypothetical protein
MIPWILLGLFIAVVTTVITLVWWWVGDQWADEEYKKFGHGGGSNKGSENTRVIKDTDLSQSAVIEDPVHE